MPGLSRSPGRWGARPGPAGAALVLAVVVVGVLGGVVWSTVVTPTQLTRVGGGLQLDEVAGATVFAATGWFCVVTAALGLVVGVLLAPVARRAATTGRAVGATLAAAVVPAVLSVLTWQVGELLGRGPTSAQVAAVPDGGTVDAAVTLGTRVSLVVGPLVALVVVLVVTAWPRHERPEPVGD